MTEENLTPREAAEMNLALLKPHKMAEHRPPDLPDQVSRKQKGVFQNRHHMQRAASVIPRNSPAHRRHSCRQLPRRIGYLHSAFSPSSAITKPTRVRSFTPNPSAGGIPRAPHRWPPELQPRQPD